MDLVDPFIGSAGRYFGYGSTFVGPSLPHGLAKPGPDTTEESGAIFFHHYSGYHYEDPLVDGFSQVHIHGTGAVDYGALLLMPTSGFSPEKTREQGYRSALSKPSEHAEPGYYAVTLDDFDIRVELTATQRCAYHRYSFAPDESQPTLIIDLSHELPGCEVAASEVQVEQGGRRLVGWLDYHGRLTGRSGGFRLFFCARLSRAPAGWWLWRDRETFAGATHIEGADVGAALSFAPDPTPLEVQIGLSYVDLDGARNNLAAELPGWDFDQVRRQARQTWNRELSRVRVAGGRGDQRVMFYTSLYHAQLHPTRFHDADGRYTGLDKQVHRVDGNAYYTDFSLWDTYRTTHPLFTLLWPEKQRDMVRSLLAMREQGGYLPKWPAATSYTNCMIGTPADVVISESYLKGITDFDAEAAFEALAENATTRQEKVGRKGVERYLELGYVPADEIGGSVSRTLEFGVADAAIAAFARALGRSAEEEVFARRSRGYRHLWDPETQFLRGKNADGSWADGEGPFDPLVWDASDYTEGTAWQYLWLVPHDPRGLAALFGSEQAMADKLEAFFATPEPQGPLSEFLPDLYYFHGNEPDIHAAYLFNEVDRPERAQHWVRQVLAEDYGTGPDGLAGNDDCGTLSAWYVFSAAGLYPSAGRSGYWITSPLFERIAFELQGGKTFEIVAWGASDENRAILSAKLDDRTIERPWLEHADIAQGGRLELRLGSEAAGWGRR